MGGGVERWGKTKKKQKEKKEGGQKFVRAKVESFWTPQSIFLQFQELTVQRANRHEERGREGRVKEIREYVIMVYHFEVTVGHFP